jgi:2-desacetyl-2-hydroxyethyl bacteriochlorophyllide A dehydrogenase
MEKVNQAWYWAENNRILHKQIPIPNIGQEDVLIQVKAVGICGTDLGILNGKNPNAKPPLPLGHEISGIVIECGKSAARLKPGDRVFLDPYIGCGHCDACRHGRKTYCTGGGRHLGIHIPGGWQEFLSIPEKNCYIVPDELSYIEASQAETLYTVLSGIYRLRIKAGSTALIIGDGPTGILFSRLLQLAGCVVVIMAGHHLERLALAKKWGATRTVDTNVETLDSALGTQLFDVTVDTVGSQTSIQQCIKYSAPSGQVILFGLPPEGKPLMVDVTTTIFRELSLLGATDNSSIWPEVQQILQSGYINMMEFVTKKFPFDLLPEAVEAARQKDIVKIVVEN